jgi:hypothetical protein
LKTFLYMVVSFAVVSGVPAQTQPAEQPALSGVQRAVATITTASGGTVPGLFVASDGTLVAPLRLVLQGVHEVRTWDGEVFDSFVTTASDARRDLVLLRVAGVAPSSVRPTAELPGEGQTVFVAAAAQVGSSPRESRVVGSALTANGARSIQIDGPTVGPGSIVLDASGNLVGLNLASIDGVVIPAAAVHSLLGMQSPRPLADLATELGAQPPPVPVAVAAPNPQPSGGEFLGGVWRSVTDPGLSVRLVSDGYRLTAAESRQEGGAGGLTTFDFVRRADGTYSGTGRRVWSCEYWSPMAWPMPEWRQNECRSEYQARITTVSGGRLEGASLAPVPPVTTNRKNRVWNEYCKSCGESAAKSWSPFIWVKDAQE